MLTENVKGFRDILGEEALKRGKIRGIIERKFRSYGFSPAETPVVEYEEFVKANNPNDEAISDIFRLQDRGQRKLALRYEFTFQLKRISQQKKLPFRRYQIGEVFRDEPISANRFRQFTQCDIDVIGSSIRDEAELLKIASEILDELGIKAAIYVNSRRLLNEILDELKIKDQETKEQIIREIDKLGKLSGREVEVALDKCGAGKMMDVFRKPESYFKKYKAYEDIKELKRFCSLYNVKADFLPSLARGLSYYNGNIFEIKTKEMKETIVAGGSYLMNGLQSAGISLGLDRLSALAKTKAEGVRCVIISIGKDKEAVKAAEALREENIPCFVIDKVSKALEYANSEKIPYVLFVGKDEVKKKKLKLRDMKSGRESAAALSSIAKKLRD